MSMCCLTCAHGLSRLPSTMPDRCRTGAVLCYTTGSGGRISTRQPSPRSSLPGGGFRGTSWSRWIGQMERPLPSAWTWTHSASLRPWWLGASAPWRLCAGGVCADAVCVCSLPSMSGINKLSPPAWSILSASLQVATTSTRCSVSPGASDPQRRRVRDGSEASSLTASFRVLFFHIDLASASSIRSCIRSMFSEDYSFACFMGVGIGRANP